MQQARLRVSEVTRLRAVQKLKRKEAHLPTMNKNANVSCKDCTYPTCHKCGDKYTGERGIQNHNRACVGACWYFLKSTCRATVLLKTGK